MGTVSSNHKIEGNIDFLGARLLGRLCIGHFKPSFAFAIVGACEFVVKE